MKEFLQILNLRIENEILNVRELVTLYFKFKFLSISF